MIRAITIPAVWVAASVASAGMAEVKLEYRHPQGSHWKIQTTGKDYQVVTINGMDLETRVETATTSTSSIGTRKPDGTLPIRRKNESLRVQMALPGGTTISFNSADANPPAKSKIPQMAALEDLYRAMAGAEFTFILGKEQKVIAVEGAQQVLNKASESSLEMISEPGSAGVPPASGSAGVPPASGSAGVPPAPVCGWHARAPRVSDRFPGAVCGTRPGTIGGLPVESCPRGDRPGSSGSGSLRGSKV